MSVEPVAHVLVMSDTHVSDAARIPAAVFSLAERADHIVHAGDHSCLEVVRVLGQYAPVTSVRGNIEDSEAAGVLPDTDVVTVSGVTFGIVHDAGSANGRDQRLRTMFPACDVRVYGHTHMPDIHRAADGSWTVNPGSPTQRRRAPHHTVCWVTITGHAVVDVDLVNIDRVA